MSAITVAGDTSGSITLQAPAVAGSSVLTLPAVSGTVITNTAGVVTQAMLSTNVAGNGPAFSAYQSVGQTIAVSSYTKVSFQTEEFDTNSNYDNATNYRFTPTVAGYYQINSCLSFNSPVAQVWIGVYKNGVIYKRGYMSGPVTSATYITTVNALVYCNGSTDYLEIYCLQVSAASQTTGVGIDITYFQAFLARSA